MSRKEGRAELDEFVRHAKWAEKAFIEGHREQEIAALRDALHAAQAALGLPPDQYWIR
jgi:hypothetical protein